MAIVLDHHFFNRPTLTVARELLGKFLVSEKNGVKTALMICEVEAYDGHEDRASHAHRGKTERTKVMFGPAGYWYVYLVYGMYWMLNIVTGPKEYPAAILIRGAGEFDGPGKLTKAIGVDKTFNEKPAVRKTGLWIEDRGITVTSIKKTARIGVGYAGSVWSKKPYRFLVNE
ncbi:MAG: DNA-3-methyladenine glycosylase [Candidatus Peregrinibacteria bacterium]